MLPDLSRPKSYAGVKLYGRFKVYGWVFSKVDGRFRVLGSLAKEVKFMEGLEFRVVS